MMKNFRISVIVLLISVLGLACKSKKEDDPSSTPTPNPADVITAPVSLHLHTYISETEVDGPFVYQSADGRKLLLDTAQIYLSNIELVKFDGSIYSVKDVVVLTKIGLEVYSIGEVPVGNYKGIRFQAGVTAADNAKVPAGNNVLNDKSMLYDGSAVANNHVFMFCSGKIDTTASKSATDDKLVEFKYKIGTNNQLKNVVMPVQNFSVSRNSMTYIHMKADYAKLFDGVDLLNKSNLFVKQASDNTSPIAIQIANNITNMFTYENE